MKSRPPRGRAQRFFERTCEPEITQDLLDWIVVARSSRHRSRSGGIRRICSTEGEAKTYARKLCGILGRIDEIQCLLLKYCAAKLDTGDTLRFNRRSDFENQQTLERIVSTFVSLLIEGETIDDSQTRLVVMQSIALAAEATRKQQQHLDGESKIVRFVTKARRAYMNYSVGAFFSRSKYREQIINALGKIGIIYVGDLIEQDARRVATTLDNSELLEAVQKELSSVSLRLGMRAGNWRYHHSITSLSG